MAFIRKPDIEYVDGYYNKFEWLTAEVNYKKDLFVSRWKKWMNYIIPRRLDFDSFNLA